jgi:hypothetical protein
MSSILATVALFSLLLPVFGKGYAAGVAWIQGG